MFINFFIIKKYNYDHPILLIYCDHILDFFLLQLMQKYYFFPSFQQYLFRLVIHNLHTIYKVRNQKYLFLFQCHMKNKNNLN